MKINLLGVMAVMGCIGMASAATNRSSMYSSIDMRNADGDTIKINRSASESYSDSRGFSRHGSHRSGMYDDIETRGHQQRAEAAPEAKQTYVNESKQTYTKGETYRKSAKRKYFIANPFYQPLQGQFGSVTTGEYMQGTYTFGEAVDRKLTEWSIKEDLSFGITDRIAIQGMAKYNWDKLVWENGDVEDKYKSNDLNLYGLGLQGRIIDTNNWISTLSGYYEHQKHGVDYFIADLKVGYKVSTSTIYGLLRGWIVDMEGDIYGDYMENSAAGGWGLLIYDEVDKNIFMTEMGLGVWTVLAEDWTLNVEGIYGLYDWHNQLSIKGAFGWQPNDYFALNLYAKTSLYDTANDKHLDLVAGDLPMSQANWETAWNSGWDNSAGKGHAVVGIDDFREWSVGLQVMFQF